MSKIFIFFYKGREVHVAISHNFRETKEDGILSIKFYGMINDSSEKIKIIEEEILGKLKLILKENGLEDSPYFKNYLPTSDKTRHEQDRKEEVTPEEQEFAIHLMIAVWQLLERDKKDITLCESILHESRYSRRYPENRNGFHCNIKTRFQSLQSPSENLKKIYDQYQRRKSELNQNIVGVKKRIAIPEKYKQESLKKIIDKFENWVEYILNERYEIYHLTPELKSRLAKEIYEAYNKTVAAHKEKSFLKEAWKRSDLAVELLEKLKFVLVDGVDEPIFSQVKLTDPADICYKLSEHYFQYILDHSKNGQNYTPNFNFAECEPALLYLKLALDFDKGKNAIAFINRLDKRFIGECARLADYIALHVLKTPELRQHLKIHEIGDIIFDTSWTEKHAVEAIHVISGPPILIDDLKHLDKICKHSSANLAILTKPCLLELVKKELSFYSIGFILTDAAPALLKHLDETEIVTSQIEAFVKNAINAYIKIKYGIIISEDTVINCLSPIFKKLEEKALEGNIDFQIMVGKIYLQSSHFTEIDKDKGYEFLQKAALNSCEEALCILFEEHAYYDLGLIFKHRKKFDKAFETFCKVSKEDKNYINALYEAGCIALDNQNKTQTAKELFEKGLFIAHKQKNKALQQQFTEKLRSLSANPDDISADPEHGDEKQQVPQLSPQSNWGKEEAETNQENSNADTKVEDIKENKNLDIIQQLLNQVDAFLAENLLEEAAHNLHALLQYAQHQKCSTEQLEKLFQKVVEVSGLLVKQDQLKNAYYLIEMCLKLLSNTDMMNRDNRDEWRINFLEKRLNLSTRLLEKNESFEYSPYSSTKFNPDDTRASVVNEANLNGKQPSEKNEAAKKYYYAFITKLAESIIDYQNYVKLRPYKQANERIISYKKLYEQLSIEQTLKAIRLKRFPTNQDYEKRLTESILLVKGHIDATLANHKAISCLSLFTTPDLVRAYRRALAVIPPDFVKNLVGSAEPIKINSKTFEIVGTEIAKDISKGEERMFRSVIRAVIYMPGV